MANRGYLINTTAFTSDPAELTRMRAQAGHIDGEVASSANRVLIPWFCCFRKCDLRPVKNPDYALQLPCTTVAQATRNLEASLPVFTGLVREESVARAYWDFACGMVRRLPLPYLTVNPLEVFLSTDPPAYIAALSGALKSDGISLPHLVQLCEYDTSAAPYPLDVLYSIPAGEADEARMFNASLLDGGFQPDFKYVHWNLGPGAQAPPAPPPVPDAAFGELRAVPTELKRLVKTADPASAGAELTLYSVRGRDHVQAQVYSRSVAAAKALEAHSALRRQLDELAHTQLEPWCRKHSFGWNGYVFQAPEWARR